MTTLPLPPEETQAVGFAPILKFFFEESGVQTIIDQHVPLDPRRKILTHGVIRRVLSKLRTEIIAQ